MYSGVNGARKGRRQGGRMGEWRVAAEQLGILLILLVIIYIILELLAPLEHTTLLVHIIQRSVVHKVES
jgi:hypothetical protein